MYVFMYSFIPLSYIQATQLKVLPNTESRHTKIKYTRAPGNNNKSQVRHTAD